MSKSKDYGLHVSPFGHVHYGLFVGDESIKAFCEQHDLPPVWEGNGEALAATATLTHPEFGEYLSLVLIPDRGQLDSETCGLIVHEAVHVWQAICEAMGEEQPSTEFEAYSLQAITQCLLEDYGIASGSERIDDED